jgi:hypothetical protein
LGKAEYEAGLEVLDLFEAYALRDPKMAGEPHPTLPTVWVFQTPPSLTRLPQIAVLYTIDEPERYVTLWNLYRLERV